MVLVTTERSAAGRQLEEQQIIANVGTYSKAVGGEKMLGLEMMEMVSEQLRKCRTPPPSPDPNHGAKYGAYL